MNVHRAFAAGMRAAASGGGFDPGTLANKVVWLDAADAATIVLDGSNNVTGINDKSGTANHFTANTTGVTYGAEQLNNQNVVVAPSPGIYFNGTNIIDITDGAMSVCFVMSILDLSERSSFFTFGEGGGNANYWAIENKSFQRPRGSLALYSAQSVNPLGHPNETALRWLLLSVRNIPGTELVSRLYGSESVSTSAIYSDAIFVHPSSLFAMGSYSQGGGKLAEIFAFDAALSDEDVYKLEGYLAHKWGLAGDLVAEHPYKSTPP